MKTIKSVFQWRRDTAERWEEVNPILRQGEPGVELDTGLMKIGDGSTPWHDLPYFGNYANGNWEEY